MTSKFVSRERCPKCAESGQDRSGDNLAVFSDGHKFCFSCNYFIGSGNKEFEELAYTYEFLPVRGITRATLEFYDVRTKVDPEGRPVSIGFKYPDGKYKVRSLSEKHFKWEPAGDTARTGLFGQDRFTPGAHKYVTITEGEFDALSLHQVLGGTPVVSVQSSVTARRDCTLSRSWINDYERIYLAFDNDPNGQSAKREVARLFDPDKVFDVKFTHRKDANEYLTAREEEDLRKIWWNSKKYLPENITSSLEDFAKELAIAPQMGVPYPFKKLTDMTYGIRTGEIVLVTAQEKVGKTEFMHFLLHNLLKETDSNVAGIFLEETKRRTLQALAGIELGRPVHLPDSGCTVDQITAACNQVVGRDDRLHLYTHPGNDDPMSLLDGMRFLSAGCGCRYILWDHPGMAVFGMGGDNERVLLDTLATRAALMVKELNFALVVVSHVNDFGQTRGSRYLGKVCDLRIDLTRETGAENPILRRTVNISIPYGRFCSNAGPVGSYLFDPLTQKYVEAANDNDTHGFGDREAA
jgi:twinkle protein